MDSLSKVVVQLGPALDVVELFTSSTALSFVPTVASTVTNVTGPDRVNSSSRTKGARIVWSGEVLRLWPNTTFAAKSSENIEIKSMISLLGEVRLSKLEERDRCCVPGSSTLRFRVVIRLEVKAGFRLIYVSVV
jgi:hypothetical protein